MKTFASILFGAGALALATIATAQPALARGDVGVYVGPFGFGVDVESYRNYCRDPGYRHRYWNYCRRFYDGDYDDYDGGYDDGYYDDGYYDNGYYDGGYYFYDGDDWGRRRHHHRDRDDWRRGHEHGDHDRDGDVGRRDRGEHHEHHEHEHEHGDRGEHHEHGDRGEHHEHHEH